MLPLHPASRSSSWLPPYSLQEDNGISAMRYQESDHQGTIRDNSRFTITSWLNQIFGTAQRALHNTLSCAGV
ncbi:hypothetical protein GCK72_007607 [Caenorhabditis remanei]|uniref:Uncharacterized protein n=1 Tax=Caenorhabditis remanei TaxID=31234 RepID=A0A6A5HIF1_CAERE|nr:hypothetical protein GCK72_007607 [Caenorhabditis remanei]KAF1767648.1 hypothetical protein GCK72_007607 [Caenorhabditis remanei]